MESKQTEKGRLALQELKIYKIIYPIIIGLAVVGYLIYQEVNIDKLRVQLLNQHVEEEWYEYEINTTNDTVYITFTDTLLNSLDNFRFEFKYYAQIGEDVKFVHDTISINRSLNIKPVSESNITKVQFVNENKLLIVADQPFKNAFSIIHFTWALFWWFLLATSMMFFRDLGYMIRLRVLTNNHLSWYQSFRIIMIWEFTSAVTPSAVGGTSIAIFLLNKEGINVGKSTAVVMATIILDEIYFIIFAPLLIFIVGKSILFTITSNNPAIQNLSEEMFWIFISGFSVIFIFSLIIAYGLFINPRKIKWIIIHLFRLPFLRKWRLDAMQWGNELMAASKELKGESFSFWAKAWWATFMSWTARYWIVNILLVSILPIDNHLLVFARQLVMWIMMVISPTPGGSGFSEYVFTVYLGEFIPDGMPTTLALIWRLITYYPYLLIGAIILPRWIRKNITK